MVIFHTRTGRLEWLDTGKAGNEDMENSRLRESFECYHSGKAIELLHKLGISLILSTYQAGKVIILSSDGTKMTQLVRNFSRPMGITLKDNMMALAGALGVTVFRTDPVLAATYPEKPNTYDAFYYPTVMFRTDYVDMHDIAFTNKGLVGVNTAFSCLCRLDAQFSFNPIWKPSFIEKFIPGDLCHLNGMATDEQGNIRLATAFGKTNSREGWRKNKLTGGLLIDVQTGEILLEGLPMPHSPRIYNGEIYLLLSATEQLIKADVKKGTYEVVAKVDGFIRGLSFIKDYAFIGVSKLRKTHTFSDLEITDKEIRAGVVIVNLKTGEVVGEIIYFTGVEELYDVCVLEGFRRVNILNYQQSLNYRALITPYGSSWVENRTDKVNQEEEERRKNDGKEQGLY